MTFETLSAPCELENSILAYQWGKPGGISSRLSYPQAVRPTPEAELWIGSHPKAPSKLKQSCQGATDLQQYEKVTGTALPYLLKMLAVNEPLSIQAHPTTAQAIAGYQRENAAGVPADSFQRNYRDANAKPELIVALESGFDALCGFRDPYETAQLLDALCDTAAAAGFTDARALAAVHGLRQKLKTAGLEPTVRWALTVDTHAQAKKTELLAALAALSDTVLRSSQPLAAEPVRKLRTLAQLFVVLSRAYPGDCGIIVAGLLGQISLRHGEALWLPPGTPHAYLRGYGIEIMGASDNVLRGGLTAKHIDVQELMSVLNFGYSGARPFTPATVGNNLRYNPDAEGVYAPPFELVRVVDSCTLTSDVPKCVLVVSGQFQLTAANKTVTATTGASFFSAAPTLQLAGSGEAYIASGPLTSINAQLPAQGGVVDV